MQRSSPDSADNSDKRPNSSRKEIMRYAGLSMEVFASVGLAIFLGIKADKWARLSFPIFSCVLPLLVIVALLVTLIKETSKKKNEK